VVEIIKSVARDLAIIDLHLTTLHGLEVMRKVRKNNSVCTLVVLRISRHEKMVHHHARSHSPAGTAIDQRHEMAAVESRRGA